MHFYARSNDHSRVFPGHISITVPFRPDTYLKIEVVSRRTNMAEKVYLDYNATTPLAPEVYSCICDALRDAWANPNSCYDGGVRARKCVEDARKAVARMINVKSSDIVFNSGGTEGNNTILHSVVEAARNLQPPLKPHVVVSNLEHASVMLTAKKLQKDGHIDLTVVCADAKTGKVSPSEVIAALQPGTMLVSLMLANNETGVIQPVGEVVRALRVWEGSRESQGYTGRVFMHTDAAQALGKVPVDATDLGVDYLTIAGHKFYGPRVGALYIRGLEDKETPSYPLLLGGGQERGHRSGTENTALLAGLGRAAELVADHVSSYSSSMSAVRDYLEEKLQAELGELVVFNVHVPERLPNMCSMSLKGAEFPGIRVASELKRCEASVGAACHSHIARASPLLLACGVPEDLARNALRISIGRDTSRSDMDVLVEDLKEAVASLRKS